MNKFYEEVHAIVLRDWMKKNKLWKALLGSFLLGLAVLAFGYGLQQIVKPSFSTNYTSFFSFGFLIYYVFLIGLIHGSDIIIDRQKFIRLLLVAPISKYSILVGKTVSLLISSFRVFLFLGLIFLFSSMQISIYKICVLVLFCSYLLLVSVAAGLFLSTLFENKGTAEQVMGFLNFILLFTSGILFPISSLPSYVQLIFKLNPLIYIVDLFRFLMLGTHEFALSLSILISVTFGLLIIIISVYQFDKNLRR